MRRWLAGAVVLVVADGAAAQEAPPGEPALDEIVVTADRAGLAPTLVQVGTARGQRLIDVPLTLTIVPRDLIDAQGGTGLHDALRNVAGVTRFQLSGVAIDSLAVRGIPLDNRINYRLGGILPMVNLVDLPLENKARVEVLKGIGALGYGFAAPSGIVNLVPKRPAGALTALQLGAGEHGALYAAADVSRSLGARLGVRVNAAASRLAPGIARVSGERYLATLAADWRVTDRLTARLDAERIAKDIADTPVIAIPAPVAGRLSLPPLPDPARNLGGRDLRYAAHETNLLGRVDWCPSSSVALLAAAGQSLLLRDRLFAQIERVDAATGDASLRILPTRGQRYRNRIVRGEASVAFATGALRHTLSAGGEINHRFQNGRIGTAIIVPQNYYAPRDVPAPPPAPLGEAPIRTRDAGLYLLDRIAWGPLAVTAGARWSRYRTAVTALTGVTTSDASRRLTPTLGLVVKPRGTLSLYATYLEGLEDGGTAPITARNSRDVLPPALSRQVEAGVKAELPPGVIAQVAVFDIRRPFAFVDPADMIFKLGGRSRYRGVEASLAGAVTRRLSLYLTGQYLDARATRAMPASLVGARIEGAPDWAGNLYAEYRLTPRLTAGGGATYVGARAIDATNTGFVDGFATATAMLRLAVPAAGRDATIQLNADNLTGTRAWSAVGNGVLGTTLPRQIRLTLRTTL